MSEVLESPPRVDLRCEQPRLYEVLVVSRIVLGYRSSVAIHDNVLSGLSAVFQCTKLDVKVKLLKAINRGTSISFGLFSREIAEMRVGQANNILSSSRNDAGATFFFE